MTDLNAKIPDITPEYVLQEFSELYDWSLLDLGIPDIHKQTQGENTTIAIIDCGQSQHFDVINNVKLTQNFSQSQTTNDLRGHSTFISGIIAAEINEQGIIGVAPKTKLIFAKAIEDSGNGSPSAITNAINWCTEQKVDIISISAGMFFDFKPMHDAIINAYNQNIIIVAATGNTGTQYFNVAYPARYPEVIGVAAYNQQHKTAPFSSRGTNVFCSLPGVDIYSTWLNNQYCKASGTSFACPIMAGICALILSKHKQDPNDPTPCTTPQQMMEHLKRYAKKLEDTDPNAVGFGTINLEDMFRRN